MINVRVNLGNIILIRIVVVNYFFFWNFHFLWVTLRWLFPLHFGWLSFNIFCRFAFFVFINDFRWLSFLNHGIFRFQVFLFLQNCFFTVYFLIYLLTFFLIKFGCIEFGWIEKALYFIFLLKLFLIGSLLLYLSHYLFNKIKFTLAS